MHKIPKDIKTQLNSDPHAKQKWINLTPLAKNEWICWVISVKKDETRKKHILRMIDEIKLGIRRPCCWAGCAHRRKTTTESTDTTKSNKRYHD